MAIFNSSPEKVEQRAQEKALKRQQKFEAKERALQEKAEREATLNSILISTGPINVEYEIIDAIFAIDSSNQGFFSGVDPNEAFTKVKAGLREKCYQLGGNAVINCQFEYRNALSSGVASSKQVLEIFAYGTAVRLG